MHLSQCLPGLNPHSDTPVEILHVILLGIVKYFWRDAVSRLNPSQQAILIIRLNSLDLSGLDPAIGSLSGETLVKYAGSLVGRDFRIIAQIAVFVLYDLLPSKIIQAWAALAAMMPLVWMPKIENKTAYFVSSIAIAQGCCADVFHHIYRQNWSLLSLISSNAQWNGHHNGSTRQNSIFSTICWTISGGLVQPFSLLLKHLNLSMQSYEHGVSTQIVWLLPVMQQHELLIWPVYGILSVVDFIQSRWTMTMNNVARAGRLQGQLLWVLSHSPQ